MEEAYGDPPIFDLCRGWNVRPANAAIHAAVRSSVPILIATGAYDAYSPLPVARRAIAEGFSHAFAYEVPFFGHNVNSTAVAVQIRNAWIERPTLPPDLSPLQGLKSPAFVLSH